MIGFRGPHMRQIAGLVAGMLLAAVSLPMDSGPAASAVTPRATPVADRDFPHYAIARSHGTTPAAGSTLVWFVQRGAVSGEQRRDGPAFPLGFVLAQRGALTILDAQGRRIMELAPGQATALPPDEPGLFASASGDLVLYDQIALVPAAGVPDDLPQGTLASDPFPAPGSDSLDIELIRGFLNPDREADVPATELPTLLLATGSDLQIQTPHDELVDVRGGEIALLAEHATIRNPGRQPATFVIAQSVPAETTTARSGLDPTLDDAWHRHGCHLNPGNQSCLTVGIAAECAIDPAGPACGADSDGDRCADIAEVTAGFAPFDPADCIGSAAGQPAVNCLFPSENLACNGDRIPDPRQTECAAEREIRQRRSPSNFSGCPGIYQPPSDDCVLVARDPTCDGFAPGHEGDRVIG